MNAQTAARFKGIWEPVNYSADVKLLDAFFVTGDEGWAAGGTTEIRGGILLHTTDGGQHWDSQYGDAQSSDRAVRNLRFLDTTHGWAMQGTGSAARLLHTADGQSWSLSGTIAENTTDYMFVSESTGVAVGSSHILRTVDGGRTWKNVAECATTVQVRGLARNVGCEWTRLQFVTPTIAYAIGFNRQVRTVAFVARSSDAGASWSVAGADVTDIPQDAFFLDETTGYLRAGAADTGQVFKTTDGGKTWTGLAASPGARMQFADPEVGWAVLNNKVSFTADSGNRWNSRQYSFPARVYAFSLPRRDRGYVVGEHGMVYRYRIVPQDYTANGMIDAPLLSGIDSPLDNEVEQFARQVQKLAQDAGLPATGFTQDVAVAGCAAPLSTASAPPAGASGFTQDTAPATGTFSQDTGAASATFDAMTVQAPQFVSKYRNLNLLSAGVQMSTQIPAAVACVRQSLQALKAARNPQSAAAAIGGLQAHVMGMRQVVRAAFQLPK